MEVHEVVEWLAGQSPTGADVDRCRRALTSLTVVARWVEVQRLSWHAQLERLADATPSILPEEVNATATGRSLRAGVADSKRTGTLAGCPPVADLFNAGVVSVEHVDALGAVANGLEPAQRSKLLVDPTVAQLAARSTADEFRAGLRRLARRIQDDDGIARARQQRREVAFRSWVDRTSGMVCFRGQLDPETGNQFLQRIECTVEDLFHHALPDDCPTDPVAKQAHLRALALLALTDAKHGRAGVTEVIVVIDADTVHHGPHDHSDIRFQTDVDIPVESVRRMMCTGVVTPVMTRDGVVLSVGRTQRLATRAQRRALRVMYRTCAIPGCHVGFDHCVPHHIHWWRRGGATDIDNLLPLCSKHHHRVHDQGWQVHLTPATRELTVTLPDGTTMSHAPPRVRAG